MFWPLCQPRDNKTFKIRCVRKLVSLFVFPFVMCRKGPFYKPILLPPPSLLAPNCLKCRGACFLKMSTPFAYTVSSLSNFFLSFRSAKYNAKTAISTYVNRVQTTPFRQLPTPYSPHQSMLDCRNCGSYALSAYRQQRGPRRIQHSDGRNRQQDI